MAKPLIELTEDNLETGLRGVPVGYCQTSFADPLKGLHYVGKPIDELSESQPEKVIYLLLNKKEGSESEINAFSQELAKSARCSDQVINAVQNLPRDGHPMKLLSSALLILGMFECSQDYRKDAMTVFAKLPHLVALIINHHAGWGETKDPDPKLGYMGRFTKMLNVPDKNEKLLEETFRLFNILHFDHGGGNLSTFVGKAVASGNEDLYGSLCAAMCALAGPLHGKANQDCLEFVKSVHAIVGDDPSPEQVEKLIRESLESGKKVYGFGHAVLRVEDPRATIFYKYAEKMFPKHPLVRVAKLLRSEGVKILKEKPKISNPYPNVDAMSGTVLTAAGFPYPEYYTVLFGLSRCVGISIQIVYERLEARGGKGTPIIRPKYIYNGQK